MGAILALMLPPNPPPLTREQLLDIQDRRRDDPDIKALLYDVHRLRQLAVLSRQYAIHERPEDRNDVLRATSYEAAVRESGG